MDRLKFIMSGVWEFLKPIITVFLSDMGPLLIKATTAAVEEMANTTMSGDEKRSAAFEAIQRTMLSEGFDVASHVINATIETAVAKLKADA